MSKKEKSSNKMNIDSVVDLLLTDDGNKEKLVLLFNDNRTKNMFTEKVNALIKQNPKFVVNNKVHFKTAQNEVRLGDKQVFLGLNAHRELLLQNYSADQLKEYEEDATDKRKDIPVRQ